MGVHRACFLTDHAGKVTTLLPNLTGKTLLPDHAFHLLLRTNWRALSEKLPTILISDKV
jgi:hypothetical protein